MACGMVGSRQGWIDVPYRVVPAAPLAAAALIVAPCQNPRISVRITPGLRQETPADVMRGEETQIGWFLAGAPGFSGVICLPGTHSKWVRLNGGVVEAFRTFMTGELFALLSGNSVLRHTVGAAGWDEMGFATAIDEVLDAPAELIGRFFPLRAEALLHGLAPETARARLSGLLIGGELAAARPYWQGQDEIVVIGAAGVGGAYATALARAGLRTKSLDGQEATLAGLARARGIGEEEQK
jgi:2-dehydro-3-deoxygalactonokinase